VTLGRGRKICGPSWRSREGMGGRGRKDAQKRAGNSKNVSSGRRGLNILPKQPLRRRCAYLYSVYNTHDPHLLLGTSRHLPSTPVDIMTYATSLCCLFYCTGDYGAIPAYSTRCLSSALRARHTGVPPKANISRAGRRKHLLPGSAVDAGTAGLPGAIAARIGAFPASPLPRISDNLCACRWADDKQRSHRYQNNAC